MQACNLSAVLQQRLEVSQEAGFHLQQRSLSDRTLPKHAHTGQHGGHSITNVVAGMQGSSRVIWISRHTWAMACLPDSALSATTCACTAVTQGRTCGGATPALGMSLMNGGCAILKLPGPRSFSSAAMLGPCMLPDVMLRMQVWVLCCDYNSWSACCFHRKLRALLVFRWSMSRTP